MKKVVVAISMSIMLIEPVKGVDNVRTTDMRCMGMGIKGVTESVYFNPASLGWKEKKECSLAYYNRFMMKGMGTTSFSFLYPNHALNVGIAFSTFGDKLYRDSQFFFSASKRWTSRWSAGINIAYRYLKIEGLEGTPAFLSADFGLSYQPVEKVMVGVSLVNLPRMSVGNQPFQYFTGYSLHAGCSWKIVPSVKLIMEVENNYETVLQGSMGLQYVPSFFIVLRAGMNTKPLQPYAGIGCRLNSMFTVDAAASYHTVLGVSAGVGLKANF